MKQCTKCLKHKDYSQFSSGNRGLGLRAQCKACRVQYQTEYYNKNKMRTQQYKKEHRKQNLQSIKLKRIAHKFKLSPEQYESMIQAQGNKCGSCGNPETECYKGKLKALSVDHCHKTGAIRGLLCGACNKALGLLKDDPEIIAKLANYIKSVNNFTRVGLSILKKKYPGVIINPYK